MKSLRSPQHQLLTEQLVQLRKEAGITQTQLAKFLDVPQSFVAKVEGMERRLDVIEFVNWLRALGQDSQSERVLSILRGASPVKPVQRTARQ